MITPAEPGIPAHDAPEPAGVIAARTIAAITRRWRLFTAMLVLAALVALTHWYVNGRGYAAESRYRPSSSHSDMSQLSGLAAQLGIDAPFPTQDETIDFYAELSRSRELLETIANRTYRFGKKLGVQSDTLQGNLFELYDIHERTDRRSMAKMLKRLRRDVTVGTNVKANLVTIRVVAPWGQLAEQMNAALLAELNKFNLQRRQSQGAAERKFAETQLALAQDSLRLAEGELENFLERNIRYNNSPQLTFAHDRLASRVELRRSVYSSLAQSYEKAKLEEVRNTPVITVVETPAGSADRVGNIFRSLLMGLIPGFLLAVAAVLLADHMQKIRADRPEEFAALPRVRFLSRTQPR